MMGCSPRVGMVKSISGGYKIVYHPEGREAGAPLEIDFTPPFRRFDLYPELERALGRRLPPPDTLHTPGTDFTGLFIINKLPIQLYVQYMMHNKYDIPILYMYSSSPHKVVSCVRVQRQRASSTPSAWRTASIARRRAQHRDCSTSWSASLSSRSA